MESEIKSFIKGKLNKSYKNHELIVFNDAEIEIMEGEIYHVSSPSQMGKSSLLRILSNVEYNDLYTLGFFVKSEDISYMPPALFYYQYMSVKQYIEFHAQINIRFLKNDAEEAMKIFGLMHNSKIKEISEREQMILNAIICLSQEKKFYVMDEPFLNIESSDIEPFVSLIKKRFDEHKTFIIATKHDLIMSQLSTKKLVIEGPSKISVTTGGGSHV